MMDSVLLDAMVRCGAGLRDDIGMGRLVFFGDVHLCTLNWEYLPSEILFFVLVLPSFRLSTLWENLCVCAYCEDERRTMHERVGTLCAH